MSSIYFLKCLGFDDINDENDKMLKIKHKLVKKKDELYRKCYWDDFACEMAHLIGLNVDSKQSTDLETNNSNSHSSNDDNFSGVNIMSRLSECVESLIKLKMCISSDLMILCCIYANYCKNSNFFNVLESTLVECLDGTDYHFKERNYQWFKHYILDSNVWLVKWPNKNSNNTSVTVLFDRIVVDVNKLLMKQKEYIWNNVQKIQNDKEMNKTFEKLCNFGINSKISQKELRQDKIENGIVSNINELDLLLQKVEMGSSAHSNFDLKFETNTKSYLTQCLAFAHGNNNTLQLEMKEYFDNYKNKLNVKCKYQDAPVKLIDRCVVKATSDYGKKEYPSCANILDFLRFSVTFDNVNDLLNGVNQFVTDINNGDVIECLVPNGILRVKNGFQAIIQEWKSLNDASYVDIKFNVIYVNKNTNERMIIEGQFLLSFLLKAKKMGHKYYSIVRQEELINNVKNQVYIIDNNYDKYKTKILTLVQNRDNVGLSKQLFWKSHVLLSIIIHKNDIFGGDIFRPLFSQISERFSGFNPKFVLFFLNCLFFHSFVLLKQPNNENNMFLTKYFNWGYSSNTMGGGFTGRGKYFYGIPTSLIVSSTTASLTVNLILQKKYLKVFTFNGPFNV